MLGWVGIDQPMQMRETSRAVDKKLLVNNNPKTAVLRAIYWCLYDKPSGSDFITTGKKRVKVILHLSNGFQIERTRTRSSSGSYSLIKPDGEIIDYKGFSNNIPIEITNAHQLPELKINDTKYKVNVQSQLDPAFLLGNGQTERISLIGSLAGSEKADAANKAIVGDKRKDLIKKNQLIELLEKEEEKLKDYDNLDEIEKTLKVLEKAIDVLDNKEEKLEKLNNVKGKHDLFVSNMSVINSTLNSIDLSSKNNIEELSDIVELYSNITTVNDSFINSKEELNNVINNLNNIPNINDAKDSLLSLKESINKLESLENLNEAITTLKSVDYTFKYDLESLNDDMNELSDLVSKYESIINLKKNIGKEKDSIVITNKSICEADKLILTYEESIKEIKENLKNELCGTECPTCGQIINNIEGMVN